MEEFLINQEVKKYSEKLLYNNKEGKILVSEIENFKAKSILFSKRDIQDAIKACDLDKGIGTDYGYGRIFNDPEINEHLVTQLVEFLNEPEIIPKYFSQGRLVLF